MSIFWFKGGPLLSDRPVGCTVLHEHYNGAHFDSPGSSCERPELTSTEALFSSRSIYNYDVGVEAAVSRLSVEHL